MPRGLRIGMVLPPLLLFVGGTANLVMSYKMMNRYREQKELWNVLKNEGVFDGKS